MPAMVLMRSAWVLAMLAVTVLDFCRMGRSGGRCGGGGVGLGAMEKTHGGSARWIRRSERIGGNTWIASFLM